MLTYDAKCNYSTLASLSFKKLLNLTDYNTELNSIHHVHFKGCNVEIFLLPIS